MRQFYACEMCGKIVSEEDTVYLQGALFSRYLCTSCLERYQKATAPKTPVEPETV